MAGYKCYTTTMVDHHHHHADDQSSVEVGDSGILGIQAIFKEDNKEVHRFTSFTADIPPLVSVLPCNNHHHHNHHHHTHYNRQVQTEAKADWPAYIPGSTHYSGRHDDGLIPALKEGGPYQVLISTVQVCRCGWMMMMILLRA